MIINKITNFCRWERLHSDSSSLLARSDSISKDFLSKYNGVKVAHHAYATNLLRKSFEIELEESWSQNEAFPNDRFLLFCLESSNIIIKQLLASSRVCQRSGDFAVCSPLRLKSCGDRLRTGGLPFPAGRRSLPKPHVSYYFKLVCDIGLLADFVKKNGTPREILRRVALCP